MKSVYEDPPCDDRRQSPYNGELIVLSPKPSTLEFRAFARSPIVEAFAPHEPQTAQFEMPVAEYAEILKRLKPQFIRHRESSRGFRLRHRHVPNTSGLTRFSFDFRTVHIDDVATKSGAPIIDSQCEGHMLGDYIRASDLSHIPQEYFALYEDGSEKDGALVYKPATA